MPKLFDTQAEHVVRLILVRHGRTAHNAQGRVQGLTDTPLDAVGRQQAQQAAERLLAYGVTALYSSPLNRAAQTAAIIAERLALTTQHHPGLTEFDFGVVSNRTLEEVAEAEPALASELEEWLGVGLTYDRTRPRIPGAEDEHRFGERLLDFWSHIQREHAGQVVAAVTHGGVIKGMCMLAVGGDLRRHMPFWADNCSLTVIDFHRGAATIRVFNERPDPAEIPSYGKPLIL